MSTLQATSTAAAVAETHSAVVLFMGDHAYKIKKPVDLGFLDFRSREARQAVCHGEVELNRRLAPDIYEGVADVIGPDGTPCDHVVVMRRMPDDRRLSSLIGTGAASGDDVRAIARVMAAFHAKAPTSKAIAAAAGRDALAERWETNIEDIAPSCPELLDADVARGVAVWARRYLAGRAPLFEQRIGAGRARDGHGDLLAADIFCLDDGPRVLDCIEFDDRLRWGDTLADVAFLAMDLERLGRIDLATAFLDHYRELTADYWPTSLAHHHIAYRAHVRAKVACVRYAQGDLSAAGVARQHLALTHSHLAAGRVRMVLVGGLPGTGKSTLAAGLGGVLGAPVLRTDEIRKDLAGLSHLEHAPAAPGEGIYRPETTTATYNELLSRARSLLELGETTVLDASWHDPHRRLAAAEVAEAAHADLIEFRCTAPPAVAAARIAARTSHGADASDATAEVAAAMAAGEPPWPSAIEVDTDRSPDAVLAGAHDALERRDWGFWDFRL